MRKGPTYAGAFIGSLVGSFIPEIWGAGQLSGASMLFFLFGGLAGIWVGYRVST